MNRLPARVGGLYGAGGSDSSQRPRRVGRSSAEASAVKNRSRGQGRAPHFAANQLLCLRLQIDGRLTTTTFKIGWILARVIRVGDQASGTQVNLGATLGSGDFSRLRVGVGLRQGGA